MNVLHDPELKTLYDKSKLKVKVWEHEFRKKVGRPPSKLDIREANSDVKNAYKTYYRLKTAALEESLMNIEGFESDHENEQITASTPKDSVEEKLAELFGENSVINEEIPKSVKETEDTWGQDLNIKTKEKKKIKNEQKSVNLSFSQKLFEGSKSSKRLPRKSLSFNRKKSENFPKPTFLSQPDTQSLSQELETNKHNFSLFDNFKVVRNTDAPPQPLNIQNALDCKSKVRNLDSGWVERVVGTSTTFSSKDESVSTFQANFDEDDIIDNSEDEMDSRSCLPPTKKFKESLGNETELISVDASQKRLDFSNIFNKVDDHSLVKEVSDPYNFTESTSQTVEKKPERKSSRNAKKRFDLQLSNEPENEDPFHSDGDPDDCDYNGSNEATVASSPQVEKPKKTKAPKKKQEPANDPELTEDKYELEYSVKSRIKTVPRIGDLKQLLRSNKSATSELDDLESPLILNDKNEKLRSKLQAKIKAGNLNENFVQVNLKKKVFVRGKKSMTTSKYKKQQWRLKKKALCGPDMDMGGCDGGVMKCFQCGEAGHFARQCPVKGDLLLPLKATEEDVCPYPTLEEAAQMAKESLNAIRKPTLKEKEDNDNVDEIDNSIEETAENDHLKAFFNEEDDQMLLEVALQLENEIKKIDIRPYLDSTTFIKPYYSLNEEGNVLNTPQEVLDALKLFGHCDFRPGQEKAVMRILSGKSTLVTLSTGSGKSLCYQLPAYLYSKREPCITLIISPLVSLMEDQVTGIPTFLRAACLHTNQTKVQREKIMAAIVAGDLNILLVSPEAVVAGERSSGFGSLLRKLPPIAFACIDEAHCVSQWSHNFRPSYLKICTVLRDRLGITTVLGLTATATRATSDSIIKHLCIPDGREGIITDTPLPDNLRLTVSKDGQRDRALLSLLASDRFKQYKSIIVYCTRREECQRVATFLRTTFRENADSGVKRKRFNGVAEAYHAGMPASRRKTIQKAFMNGDLRIVVATVAFGMGINKSDIRSVIHYNMPMSFESYVQEVGRAGRDGLPAHCHLFLDSEGKDENELRRHVHANSLGRRAIRKLLERCFVPCGCKSTCPRHEVAFSIQETVQALDVPEENIETLLCYLELHEKRYIEVLSHAYTMCKVISYEGPNQIKKAAKNCPPLAMALALRKTNESENVFEFPVVEIASAMGWDSGICKHKLKNLEWTSENNRPKRSSLSVNFSNLGFRLLSPGNLTSVELDEALDSLCERVKEQEKTSLLQLNAVHTTLTSVTAPSFQLCVESDVTDKEMKLKEKIRTYFESPDPLDAFTISSKPINEEQVVNDIKSLVCMYRDNTFSGLAIARIFHGIQSPNYPAVMWGRCKFWRSHISSDFNQICQIATREILKMK